MSKMRYVEKKFKEAEDYLRNTGEGLTTADKKMGITQIKEKVLGICLFYYQVKPFMSESVAVNPPYIGETGMNENFEEMLLGTNSVQGLHESTYEDGDDLNSQKENSSEEPDFEEEIRAQHEPIPVDASKGTPLVPEATQSTITPNQKPKEKKKKPKSFQESIQDMQDQNCMLMEKKLDMQSVNQQEKMLLENQKLMLQQQRLQFEREDSREKRAMEREDLHEKRAMESRRMDLEFMRIDQQRQELLNRELALQVELAKLRGSL